MLLAKAVLWRDAPAFYYFCLCYFHFPEFSGTREVGLWGVGYLRSEQLCAIDK